MRVLLIQEAKPRRYLPIISALAKIPQVKEILLLFLGEKKKVAIPPEYAEVDKFQALSLRPEDYHLMRFHLKKSFLTIGLMEDSLYFDYLLSMALDEANYLLTFKGPCLKAGFWQDLSKRLHQRKKLFLLDLANRGELLEWIREALLEQKAEGDFWRRQRLGLYSPNDKEGQQNLFETAILMVMVKWILSGGAKTSTGCPSLRELFCLTEFIPKLRAEGLEFYTDLECKHPLEGLSHHMPLQEY